MKRNALMFVSFLTIALVIGVFAPLRAVADDDDPSGRVARLSFARGAVSFDPAGTDEWVDAVVNRPVTTGDKLWTDKGARAELHMGYASIRLSENTGFSFLDLSDNVTQIRLTEGTVRVRVKRLEENETFEIDTPNLAFTVLRPGTYSVNVSEVGDTTVVRVLTGDGEVTGGGSAYAIHANQLGTFSGTDQLNADVQGYEGESDDFDSWCADRDRREDRSASARYVSDDVVGYEDLDDYGGWRPVPEYGTVWFPRATVVGWAPYRYGHWAWISPWGWTWVDDAPWGFAPFHYGRWIAVGGAWGWVPCRPRSEFVGVAYVRPVYAPALVAWVGGSHFAVGVAIGGGGNVGWFPLGPREVYVPSYRVSRTYVNNVNISNTSVNTTVVNNYYNNTVVNKNVNVTNVRYVNQGVPGAVTATSHATFTSARPVGRNTVRVDQREVASAPVNVTTPAMAPERRSVLGAGAAARVRPPASLQSRAVVAKTAPPPAPVSFAKQQEAIQANGGRPLAISQTRQLQSGSAQQPRPNIRIAPPAKVATPQNVQANRPGQPQNNTVDRPGQRATRRDAGTPPVNNANRKPNNDRPPSSRSNDVSNPNNRNDVKPQLEQKQNERQQQLRQKQEQERLKIEERQQQEQQKLQEKSANGQRQQVIEQRQQQQREQLQRKHEQQQQKLEQKQQQERRKEEKRPTPKPKDNRPPHNYLS
jgi:hypothetical protein